MLFGSFLFRCFPGFRGTQSSEQRGAQGREREERRDSGLTQLRRKRLSSFQAVSFCRLRMNASGGAGGGYSSGWALVRISEGFGFKVNLSRRTIETKCFRSPQSIILSFFKRIPSTWGFFASFLFMRFSSEWLSQLVFPHLKLSYHGRYHCYLHMITSWLEVTQLV